MLVYRTIVKKVFWELDLIILQNLSDILPLFCTPTWPSHHLRENQEFNLVFFFLVEEVGPWERSWFMNRSDVISFGGLKLEMLAL